jgi:hypothetical protein
MNRLRLQNLILTSLVLPLMVLSSCSFAGRYNSPIFTRPTFKPIPTVPPVTMPRPSPTVQVPTPTPTATPTPIPNSNGLKKATYYWGKFDPATINSYIDGASNNGISIIYLDLESYVYGTSTASSINQLLPVVQYAKSRNVSIHGLIGAPTFAQPLERPLVLKALEIIKQFNTTQVTPIGGIHLNIEFYNIPEFKTTTSLSVKNTILNNYLDFHKIVTQEVKSMQSRTPSFQLSSTLPHFTDFAANDNPIPFIYYDGYDLSVFEQVAKVLSSTPNSTIVIMSYRSTALGADSISGLVTNEFKLVSKYNTKITIGVETHDEQSTYISMFGKSKKEINDILVQATDQFKSNKNFDGVAIHEIKAYLQAK